jgi:hypothetical protein
MQLMMDTIMKSFLSKAKEALENSEAVQSALEQAKAAAAPAIESAFANAKTKAADAMSTIGENLKERQASIADGTLKANVTDKAKEIFDKLPPIPETFKFPLVVTEEQLNQLATKAITDDSRIKSLNIQCRQDRLIVSGTFNIMSMPLNFSTELSLESCELSPARKVIVLRRHDAMSLGGESMLSSFMAHIVKIIICGLFGVDLGAISLKRIQGVSIDKTLITADIEAMGAMDSIMTGLRQKARQGIGLPSVNPLIKITLSAILDSAENKLLEKLHLQNVVITDKGMQAEVVLGKAS